MGSLRSITYCQLLIMAKQEEKKKSVDKLPQKRRSQTIKQKAKLHTEDITDIVTDEDVRDAKIELNIGAKEEPHEKHLPPSVSGTQATDIKKKKGGRKVSPWDMVDDKGEP